VLGAPRPDVFGGDRVRQGAPGRGVGEQDGFLRGEQFGGFRHEVHAAENDGARLNGGCQAGEGQGVTGVVGDVLDFGALVVVREDDRVAFFR